MTLSTSLVPHPFICMDLQNSKVLKLKRSVKVKISLKGECDSGGILLGSEIACQVGIGFVFFP